MGETRKVILLVFGAVFFFVLGGILWPKDRPKPNLESGPTLFPESVQTLPVFLDKEEEAKVTKVIDGDTIVLEDGRTVRYIGIDTPETRGDCLAVEAARKNEELVLGKGVKLEKDISETDKYGRILRYVYVGEIFVNDYLVREGYAKVSTYPPDVKYQKQFIEAERYARGNNLGLWSKCNNTSLLYSNEVNPSSSTSSNPQGNINCTTNTYNCTDFKTQVEAQIIFDQCGGVSNDVHKLDRDKDGKVCESLPQV